MKFFWSQQTLHKLPKFVMMKMLLFTKKGVTDCEELGKSCTEGSALCGGRTAQRAGRDQAEYE